MQDDPGKLIAEIEDLLFPQRGFDVYERSMYYHLIRHTHLIGRDSRMFPLPTLSTAVGISEDRARKTIRALEQKGCIELQRSRQGHLVKVFTPEELGIAAPDETDVALDLDELDFVSGRPYVKELLAREAGRCFYCLASIKAETCVLDHVSAQVDGGGNSYKTLWLHVTTAIRANREFPPRIIFVSSIGAIYFRRLSSKIGSPSLRPFVQGRSVLMCNPPSNNRLLFAPSGRRTAAPLRCASAAEAGR